MERIDNCVTVPNDHCCPAAAFLVYSASSGVLKPFQAPATGSTCGSGKRTPIVGTITLSPEKANGHFPAAAFCTYFSFSEALRVFQAPATAFMTCRHSPHAGLSTVPSD